MPEVLCSSCKKSVANESGTVNFPCPGCSKTMVIRCRGCRKKGVRYTCAECGFKGPN